MSLDLHGLAARGKRNLSHGGPLRGSGSARRRRDRRQRPARLPDRTAHGPVAQRQVSRAESPRARTRSPGVRSTGPWIRAQFDTLERDILASLQGVRSVRPGLLRRRRSGVPPADSRHQRIRLAQPLRAQSLHRRSGPVAAAGAAVHGHRRAELQGRPGPPRHAAREVAIALNFAKRLVLIAGTSYAGEMKKSIFTVLNYLLPLQGVLPMHCSANVGRRATWRSSSGSRAPARRRCRAIPSAASSATTSTAGAIAACSTSRADATPRRSACRPRPSRRSTRRRAASARCSRTWSYDEATRQLDFDDDRLTENTRAAYPISFIDNAVPSGQGGHPQNIVMLTADAFGVLPPLSRLTPDGRHVSLPVRVHGEGGRHRERRDRAEGDLQRLLRGAVPAAAARPLRAHARREDRAAPGEGLAGEHRLDRRAVRRRLTHEDRLHAGDDPRGALGCARRGRRTRTIPSSISKCRPRVPTFQPRSSRRG